MGNRRCVFCGEPVNVRNLHKKTLLIMRTTTTVKRTFELCDCCRKNLKRKKEEVEIEFVRNSYRVQSGDLDFNGFKKRRIVG